ncbi:hypothetical protein MtrunA17_Chr7g0252991 [Medicago truncatula]|uniref:Uncharacterized protein n=1 Tax=Medicago truncatula TaxID=3880 RepID=A0A396H905_MEDTR|nr:hypothetical protein MtrunA17_Chr7g0252991 [Medicago truncatula]
MGTSRKCLLVVKIHEINSSTILLAKQTHRIYKNRIIFNSRRNDKAIISSFTHISRGTEVRTPIIASALTISIFYQLS